MMRCARQGLLPVLLVITGILTAPQVDAEPLRVAVAANFRVPFERLLDLLPNGIEVQPVYGSSGLLAAQIIQGAPYDVFLSADHEKELPFTRMANARRHAAFERFGPGGL